MASSLEILRPSPSPTHELDVVDPLAKELENKSSILVKLISKHGWKHPDIEQYLDSTWYANQPWKSPTVPRGRQAHFDHLTFAGRPVDIEIKSISAEVNEEEGRASVWMMIVLPNEINGLCRESITVMQWRLKGGVWKCFEQTALCGGSGFSI